jgi:hypothetical protein
MLLDCPSLKDAKVFHDWGNNTVIVQRTNIVKTILVTKKLRTPTKHPKMLVCYDFHSIISNEEEDLMFARKLGLFPIGTIAIPIPVRLK